MSPSTKTQMSRRLAGRADSACRARHLRHLDYACGAYELLERLALDRLEQTDDEAELPHDEDDRAQIEADQPIPRVRTAAKIQIGAATSSVTAPQMLM